MGTIHGFNEMIQMFRIDSFEPRLISISVDDRGVCWAFSTLPVLILKVGAERERQIDYHNSFLSQAKYRSFLWIRRTWWFNFLDDSFR
jgi:hypothetical protein